VFADAISVGSSDGALPFADGSNPSGSALPANLPLRVRRLIFDEALGDRPARFLGV
jgi:hypothetical protein